MPCATFSDTGKKPKNCPNNGVPDILDWGPDCCDVKFPIPESDRGAKISHYQVEIKENKMNEFTKGPVFTIKEVQEKNGQIHAEIKGIFIISPENFQFTCNIQYPLVLDCG